MVCEERFIAMKLIWHGYLVLSLDICVHETPTETGLSLQPRMHETIHCYNYHPNEKRNDKLMTQNFKLKYRTSAPHMLMDKDVRASQWRLPKCGTLSSSDLLQQGPKAKSMCTLEHGVQI